MLYNIFNSLPKDWVAVTKFGNVSIMSKTLSEDFAAHDKFGTTYPITTKNLDKILPYPDTFFIVTQGGFVVGIMCEEDFILVEDTNKYEAYDIPDGNLLYEMLYIFYQNPPKQNCKCCEKDIEVLYQDAEPNFMFDKDLFYSESIFKDATAVTMHCGYGSKYDGDRVNILICDNCIK
jgi:hypothetical protein